MGNVTGIYIAHKAGDDMVSVKEATLEAGKGILGDRYYYQTGTFSDNDTGLNDREVTLIESEKIQAFNAEYSMQISEGQFRRNIVTQGVDLNALVGADFSVGGVYLRGVRLCEPCAYLANLLVPEVVKGLLHKAGLRARIVSGGPIKLGDDIAEI